MAKVTQKVRELESNQDNLSSKQTKLITTAVHCNVIKIIV